MLEVKDQGHNFSELWLVNLPFFNRSVVRASAIEVVDSGPAVQGVHRTRARAQGARKSSGFRVKFWYRTITP